MRDRYGKRYGSLMDNWPSRSRGELQREAAAERKRKEAKKKRREKQPLMVRVRGLVWCRVCGKVHERRSQMAECTRSEWYALWREKIR